MFICNIVYQEDPNVTSEDENTIKWLEECAAINLTTDLRDIIVEVPTLFWGITVARDMFPGFLDKSKRHIMGNYYWSYTDSEISHENWVTKFVKDCGNKWFNAKDNGIDVVFNEFDAQSFVDHLDPWPLIHEGTYEIYIADFRGDGIIIHSVKKDTLEYIDINPSEWLTVIYEALNYQFLSIESKRFDLKSPKLPIFLDDLLFANVDKWNGVDDIISNFSKSTVDIDRKKVITYYLKQSEFLRPKFDLYI
jgi:hypothetical protein